MDVETERSSSCASTFTVPGDMLFHYCTLRGGSACGYVCLPLQKRRSMPPPPPPDPPQPPDDAEGNGAAAAAFLSRPDPVLHSVLARRATPSSARMQEIREAERMKDAAEQQGDSYSR